MDMAIVIAIIFISLINISYGIFYTKIMNTPIFSNKLLKYHHIVLLKKTPFIKNQTTYNDIYIVDFIPYGNVFELILGKKIKGTIRIFYIDKCMASDIYRIILIKKKQNNKLKLLYEIKNIDTKLFNKLTNWDLSFNIYNRNCRHFSKYII